MCKSFHSQTWSRTTDDESFRATQPALFDGKHYNIGNKSSRSYKKKELTGHSGRFLHQSLSTRLIHSPGLQLTCEKTGSRFETRRVVWEEQISAPTSTPTAAMRRPLLPVHPFVWLRGHTTALNRAFLDLLACWKRREKSWDPHAPYLNSIAKTENQHLIEPSITILTENQLRKNLRSHLLLAVSFISNLIHGNNIGTSTCEALSNKDPNASPTGVPLGADAGT